MVHPIVAGQDMNRYPARAQHSADVGEGVGQVEYMFESAAVENEVEFSGKPGGRVGAVQIKQISCALAAVDVDALHRGETEPGKKLRRWALLGGHPARRGGRAGQRGNLLWIERQPLFAEGCHPAGYPVTASHLPNQNREVQMNSHGANLPGTSLAVWARRGANDIGKTSYSTNRATAGDSVAAPRSTRNLGSRFTTVSVNSVGTGFTSTINASKRTSCFIASWRARAAVKKYVPGAMLARSFMRTVT